MNRRVVAICVFATTIISQTPATISALPPSASKAPIDSVWQTEVFENLHKAEYNFQAVSEKSGVWSAPNRANELRSRISTSGLEIFPRKTSSDGEGAIWKLKLQSIKFGRVDRIAQIPEPVVSFRETRAELRSDLLTEWIENREDGIEQGWTIDRAPPGTSNLYLEVSTNGNLTQRIEEGERSIVFLDMKGQLVLRYRNLLVHDAHGKTLPARFVRHAGGFGIEVDDSDVVYPITVDPIMTGSTWSVEGGQLSAFLGASVASAGDVNNDGFDDIIVGAPAYDNGQINEGRAYVYHGSATGPSTTFSWKSESNQTLASFGNSVSSAGDFNGDGYGDVIIGAELFDGSTGSAPSGKISSFALDHGRAVIFLGSATGLSIAPLWTVTGSYVGSNLGRTVASAGDVNADGYDDVIIGIPGGIFTFGGEGQVYVVYGAGTTSAISITSLWGTPQSGANFGASVSGAEDVNGDGFDDVIVGAPFFFETQTHEGFAYVFHGSSTGIITTAAQTLKLGQRMAYFGQRVAGLGDVNADGFSDVAVSAPDYDGGEINEGKVFVYLGSPSGISSIASWTAESNQAGAKFGSSIASAGDINGDGIRELLVGAGLYDNGETDEGRVFLYLGSAAGLNLNSIWSADSNQANAHFGTSVSSAGDVNGDGHDDVIVGAPDWESSTPELGEGRASLFLGGGFGLGSTSAWSSESNVSSSYFGRSVASAGDVNNDGFDDVIIGADGYDGGGTDEGRAFVFHGSATGPSNTPNWTVGPNAAFSSFGISVSSAGDVNNDGFDDVIVGAYLYDVTQPNNGEGRAYLYLGSSAGLLSSPAWTKDGETPDSNFGNPVAAGGDLNNDGFGDVLVSAVGYGQSAGLRRGKIYAFFGSASGLSLVPNWIIEGTQGNANFGIGLASAGDVDADGYSDVIVGASGYTNGQIGEGRGLLYRGSTSGPSQTPSWTYESNIINSWFGSSVAGAGDINGDNYDDVIIGAPVYSHSESNEGRAYLFRGQVGGLQSSPSWTIESNQTSAQYGSHVASAGDVNGDGYSDVAVASKWWVVVYHGAAAGLPLLSDWRADQLVNDEYFGDSVASAGDVDGDGYSDFLIGARRHSNGEAEEGKVYLYLGNKGP